ncbi:MAG TPA: trypsin-like peptidase domain-containing protein [Solirubrobacterales bacterium]|nr:trypsin-like peptidase domain-containing protein [Solirubrobacterales bacterium]
MSKPKQTFRSPFVSALLGGLVVAVLGLIAIATGLVQSDGGSTTTTVAAPLSAPIDAKDEGGSGNVVNQIYKADGEGVAFIEAQLEAPSEGAGPEGFSPFGEPEPAPEGGTASGSGFVIDDEGHVLTNNHVVEGASKVTVKLGASEESYEAEVVGADPGTDVALLKVDAPQKEFHPLTLGRSSQVEVGDPVVAIGNPFGLDRTVTSGIVSALQRNIQAPNGFSISHVIQTDAAINPGNSGGPLINAEGAVIGINAQIATGGGGNGNVGIGFSIPIDTVRAELEQLKTTGEVDHAFIGISGGTVTPELAKALNLPVEEGVIVQTVVKDGPADKAGIEAGNTSATINGEEVSLGGDIITEVDGEKLKSMDELVEIIQEAEPGDGLQLTILRGGQEKTADVTLGTQPDGSE